MTKHRRTEVCADNCQASYTCKAFSHLESESTCELGDLPNLPDDEDPDGKHLYVCKMAICHAPNTHTVSNLVLATNKHGTFHMSSSPSDVPPADCRTDIAVTQGYQLHNDKYYLLPATSETDADDARAVCQAAGADLAVFKTPNEYATIMEVIGEILIPCKLKFCHRQFM